MATTAAVQGAGLLTGVWKKLEKAIYNAGGSEEYLARLDKSETDQAFANFAAEIVRTIKVAFTSFGDQIRAGKYAYTYGHARRPENIRGQVFHPATNEVELADPAELLTTQEVWERYGSRMADFSEFLDYGIKNPDVQREFPVVILWRDKEDQFWAAIIYGSRSSRQLNVVESPPDDKWRDLCRFLVRKKHLLT